MRRPFLPMLLFTGLILLTVTACRADKAPVAVNGAQSTMKPYSSEQAAWVYMHPPLPSDQVGQPLFSGKDDARIAQLLGWLDQAKPAVDPTLSMPRRSKRLQVQFKDGSSVGVSPAWRCRGGKDDQGNISSVCTEVENKIKVDAPGETKSYFADSPELYVFISKNSPEWMPPVPIYQYPKTIRPGLPFTLEGNAWVSDKVILELKKGDVTAWSAEVVPSYGYFKLPVTLTGQYEAGAYTLYFRSPQGRSWGVPVEMEQPAAKEKAQPTPD